MTRAIRMPFVFSPKLLDGHMQAPNDGVRIAAEHCSPALERQLLEAWDAVLRQVRQFPDAPAVNREIAVALAPAAGDLLLARSAGQHAMLRAISAATSTVRKFSVGFVFDRLAPQTQTEADTYAARFVREIADDTRATIAGVVQDGVARGLPPWKVSRAVRESIGLTIAQAGAVQNYRRLLETGDHGALERALRDRRFDPSVERHISGLAQLTDDQVDQRVEAYRQRYVRYRATTIARYETLAASNGGALTAIRSSIATGLLPRTTRKGWLLAHDELTCERCRSIPQIQPDGVGIDELFTWRYATRHGVRSGQVQAGPLHPDCRCTTTFRVMRT